MTPFLDFRPAYGQVEPMERKFVDGYVKDIETIAAKTGQPLEAVLHADFPYELDQRAYAMLARPMVRAAIAERVKELSELYDISIMRTLKANAVIAYSSIMNYIKINKEGEPEINLRDCTPEQLEAIKGFEWEDKPRGGRKIKFVLHDKLTALGNLMRYQGLFADDNPHWRNQEASLKPSRVSTLPANSSEDDASQLWARTING